MSAKATETPKQRSDIKILVIEDNLGDLALIKNTCRKINGLCTFIEARDGDKALDLLRVFKTTSHKDLPDFIILDLNLPKRDGREILDFLKQDDVLKMIPVTIFSSSSAIADIQGCYKKHANSYMVKPFDIDEFEKAIFDIYDFWAHVAAPPFAA